MAAKTELRKTSCCAMRELADISAVEPKKAIQLMCLYMDTGLLCPGAQGYLANESIGATPLILFTSVVKRIRGDHTSSTSATAGEDLRDFILYEKLGTVEAGPEAKNPITSNVVRAWFWLPNYPNLKVWYGVNPLQLADMPTGYVPPPPAPPIVTSSVAGAAWGPFIHGPNF